MELPNSEASRSELPIGEPVEDRPAKRPVPTTLEGRYVRLEPLNATAHGTALWNGSNGPENDHLWLYLPDGPFEDRAPFDIHLQYKANSPDAVFFALIDLVSGEAGGHASLMRIEPAHRVIEVGNILLTPEMQQTTGATEAMYLLARHVFEDLGYRRYEWKCNACNEPSHRAALRLGFTFEGVFRQHYIVKGRNRDTAWFSMLDSEWAVRKRGFESWLSESNFDGTGRQRRSLAECHSASRT